MSRYIDADKLIDDTRPFAEYDSNRSNKDWARRFEIAIGAQPTADVRENVRGEWRMADENCGHAHEFICTACGESVFYDHYTRRCDYDFCPNCGADMRGEQDG